MKIDAALRQLAKSQRYDVSGNIRYLDCRAQLLSVPAFYHSCDALKPNWLCVGLNKKLEQSVVLENNDSVISVIVDERADD